MLIFTNLIDLDERVETLLIYGVENQSALRTAATSNKSHPNMTTSHRYVLKLITKFTETESIANVKHNRSRVLSDDTEIEVLDILQNAINPLITEALENQGARDVRKWLYHEFPNKWIRRRGSIEWPARSPDLSF
ncbi:hypothetical protein ABEB36_005694 [Hypothenemus hampei]|uniref:Uncharacterized protein n=1 Tax=Hypothenemus hampei TaxID=57062 RepID=A0ABD1EZ47_HYPHA